MKKLSKLVLCSILILSMVGCGTKKGGKDPMEEYGCNTLNVYNWGVYIGEDVNRNFEKEFNVKVNYSLFASNEEMYTKLLGGSKYDVLVPSDYMIERLIDEDMLQPIDKTRIPNIANVATGLQELEYDPDNTYSVPYFWGMVGIIYNKNNVDAKEVEDKGFDILRDSKYAGKVFVYDSERDSFMMAFKALGYSMNTESEEEINKAYEWLIDMNKAVSPSYVTDEVIDGMINGEKDIAVLYSGDAAYILSDNPDMAFSLPKSGTNFWSDGMVIPKNASCPALANEYINYIMSYEASLDNSVTAGYPSSNQQVLDELSGPGGDYEGNDAFLPRTDYEKDEIFKHNEALKRILSDLWVKVKISK